MPRAQRQREEVVEVEDQGEAEAEVVAAHLRLGQDWTRL